MKGNQRRGSTVSRHRGLLVLTWMAVMACGSSTDVSFLAGLPDTVETALTCEAHGPLVLMSGLRRGERCEMEGDDWELVLYRTPSGSGHHVERTWTVENSDRWRHVADSLSGALEAIDSLDVCRQSHRTAGQTAAHISMWRHPDYLVGVSTTTRTSANPYIPYQVILHAWSLAQWGYAADSACADQLALQ